MNIKQVVKIAAILFVAFCLSTCHPWQWGDLPEVNPECPVVTSVSPSRAAFGDTVTVKGRNFDPASLSQFTLTLNGISVSIINIIDSSTLRFVVPQNVGSNLSGVVQVNREGSDCGSPGSTQQFTYLLTATSAEVYAGQPSNSMCPTCFSSPQGMDVDEAGNVYVADRNHHVIKKISDIGGAIEVTRIAGIENTAGYVNDQNSLFARFKSPGDVALDAQGNIYVAEEVNCTLRKRTTAGVVLPFAGKCGDSDFTDGNCSVSKLVGPSHVAQDGAVTYIADSGRIRKVDASADANCPVISPLVGQGFGLTNAYGIEFSKALMPGRPIEIANVQSHG